MTFFNGVVFFVIAFFLVGCNEDGVVSKVGQSNHDSVFNVDINEDEYASIKHFSGRSSDRKSAAYQYFSERQKIASHLMDGKFSENKEVRLKLAEVFQKEVLDKYFDLFLKENISDEKVHEYYELNKKEFVSYEYSVLSISLRNSPSPSDDASLVENRAIEVANQISDGKDLSDIKGIVTSNLSLSHSNAEPQTLEKLSKLAVGELTQPIQTRTGIKLLRLDAVNELDVPSEKVMPKIRYKFQQEIKKAEYARLMKLSL